MQIAHRNIERYDLNRTCEKIETFYYTKINWFDECLVDTLELHIDDLLASIIAPKSVCAHDRSIFNEASHSAGRILMGR